MKKIRTALISVFYKDGLEPLVRVLSELGVTIYSTGGTQHFIEGLGINVVPVENLTSYPSILGGRVKTLHPSIFGGILGRRANEQDVKEMQQYDIPGLDLVIVDLYPFEETVASTKEEQAIIDKIDIGGPSMIRGAAKNFIDVAVIAAKTDYNELENILRDQKGSTTLEQRKSWAAKAFKVVKQYDIAISDYFNPLAEAPNKEKQTKTLRYGENPHQQGMFTGNLDEIFIQHHGKEISYNNLVDIDAAIQLMAEFKETCFAIIKHTNVCGIASREKLADAWKDALAGDPESAFGGVLISNTLIDAETAKAISEIFFEVLIAPVYEAEALEILKTKKNRILLQQKMTMQTHEQFKSLLNGVLIQSTDNGNVAKWEEAGGRNCSEEEKSDLAFANFVCKHLKSNAIALVKNKQLVGKGCGQTSRIDALRQAIAKAKQSGFDLQGAVMASDAFFPFNDCVQLGHEAGITAFIEPGGSMRDQDSIDYCKQNHLALVMSGLRHFKH
jgi:phosphoribosylaminoimidazolecarboxamide formyltransferase/IMP cyclohydrolase